MNRPRVLRAEDRPGVTEALRHVLEPEFDIIAVVGDGHALLRTTEAVAHDVIVTDVMMPGLDEISTAAALVARGSGTRVVLVAVYDDAELAERGYATGPPA